MPVSARSGRQRATRGRETASKPPPLTTARGRKASSSPSDSPSTPWSWQTASTSTAWPSNSPPTASPSPTTFSPACHRSSLLSGLPSPARAARADRRRFRHIRRHGPRLRHRRRRLSLPPGSRAAAGPREMDLDHVLLDGTSAGCDRGGDGRAGFCQEHAAAACTCRSLPTLPASCCGSRRTARPHPRPDRGPHTLHHPDL